MLTNIETILLIIFFGAALGVGAAYLIPRYKGFRFAKYIVENQCELAPVELIERGCNELEGEELKTYKILIKRVRSEFGHNGVKVGHIAWILNIVTNDDNESVDIQNVKFPSFQQKNNTGTIEL